MKSPIIVAFLFLLTFSNSELKAQSPGLVTIKGKQFYVENQNGNVNPFFPTICNLQVNAYYEYDPSGLGHYFLESRNFEYGITLDEEFAEIRSLNFNAIRLCVEDGMGPIVVHDDVNNVVTGLQFSFYSLPNLWYHYVTLYPGNTNRPYSDDANLNTLLSIYEPVLTLAEAHELKVIMLSGGVHEFDHLPQSLDHVSYFQSRLAEHYLNDTRIMAWDLHNEPTVVFNSNNIPIPTKRWVCENVARLYDSFHEFDPNHLITIGSGAVTGDILSFDPNIMKVDFFSLHTYPIRNGGNLVDHDRQIVDVLSEIYWFNEESNKPYIIGETGFGSNANFSTLVDGLDGTVSEAATFLNTILQSCVDCGFSGFSWWNFQNKSNIPSDNYGDVSWGMLEYEPPPMTTPLSQLRKPALTNEIIAFNEGVGVTPGTCTKPADYYQPNHYPDNHQNTTIIRGWVRDQNNQPIKNAVVYGWSITHTNSNDITKVGESGSRTITDEYGFFELRPDPGAFNGSPSPGVIPLEYNHSIAISAAGCDLERRGMWYGGAINDGESLTLIKYPLNYNDFINGITIQNQRKDFNAWNNLDVNDFNVIQYGETDLTAREEINLTEFFSKSGTESHIFTFSVFPDCAQTTDNMNKVRSPISMNNPSNNENTKEIILKFKKENETVFHVWPNPTDGKITVEYFKTKKLVECNFKLFDIMGKLILSGNIEAGNNRIDLSSGMPGIYILELFSNSTQQQYKIVKQ
jgi:hypothetical protein